MGFEYYKKEKDRVLMRFVNVTGFSEIGIERINNSN